MYKRRLIFWSACIGMLLFGVVLISLGSIVPDLKHKLALNDLSSGTLFAILPFGILSGSLFFGPFADKNGYRSILVLSCLLIFLGFEGIALARSEALLRLCIFITGFGGGIINGATNAVVSDISEDSRSADISLLGVFFAIGALGMPLVLGVLRSTFSFEVVVTAIGFISFVTGIFYLFIVFPPPKQAQGIDISAVKRLVSDKVLLLIAAYLFFQSAFEGIVNNWTTTYLIDHLSFRQDKALFALSAYVTGMALMRLIMGTVFRTAPVKIVMIASYLLIIAGSTLTKAGFSYASVLAGLVLTGAGLAAGFPVMLGFTGDRYPGISGTAFSFVLFTALCGNILCNYGMGVISRNLGVQYLPVVTLAESLILIILFILIINKVNRKPNLNT